MPDDATVKHVQQGPSPKTGEIVAGYEILDVIGAGGMGRVYKVRHTLSNRIEAMKVVLPDLEGNPDLVSRFHREIQVLAGLNHPNIVGLHTAMQVEHRLVMILEMVEGTSLKELMKDGRLAVDDVIQYGCQVLSALGYAHDHGVVHRDVKPENILRTADGNIKLVDFGIARQELAPKLTSTGTAVGSLYYISPEQVQNLALDARSDIYSLGVTLYELLTGERPIKGETAYLLMNGHLNITPVAPHVVVPDIPEDLSNAIMKSLAKDPADRFQTAAEFQAALEGRSVTSVLKAMRPTTQTGVKPPPAPKRKLWPALAALAGVVVLAAVGGIFYFNRPAPEKQAAVVTPSVPAPVSSTPAATTPSAAPSPAPEAAKPAAEPAATKTTAGPAADQAAATTKTSKSPAATQTSATKPAATDGAATKTTAAEPPKETATAPAEPPPAAPKEPEKVEATEKAEKVAPARGIEAWPPGLWEREGGWFVHRGGDFVLFPVMPLNGVVSFTATMTKGHRIQWVVDYRDKNNYVLFQLDDKSFQRRLVRGGKASTDTNVPHDPSNFYTIQIDISPHSLVHSLVVESAVKPLDKLEDGDQDLTAGSFGFYLPGKDEMGLANFKYSPRK